MKIYHEESEYGYQLMANLSPDYFRRLSDTLSAEQCLEIGVGERRFAVETGHFSDALKQMEERSAAIHISD